MRRICLCLVAMAWLSSFNVGCMQNAGVVRGQAPADAPQTSAVAYPVGDEFQGNPDCPPSYGNPHCKFCRLGMPHRTCYSEPQNMTYPPRGDMPAVVQYPYYTTKGPDCFFAK